MSRNLAWSMSPWGFFCATFNELVRRTCWKSTPITSMSTSMWIPCTNFAGGSRIGPGTSTMKRQLLASQWASHYCKSSCVSDHLWFSCFLISKKRLGDWLLVLIWYIVQCTPGPGIGTGSKDLTSLMIWAEATPPAFIIHLYQQAARDLRS